MKVVVLLDTEGELIPPLTSSAPKAKLEILGKPLLLLVLEKIIGLPASEIVIISDYKTTEIEAMFIDEEYNGIPLTVFSAEENLCNTSIIKNIAGELDETILILNTDSYFDFDLSDAFSRHINNKNDVTIVCKNVDDPREFSVVVADEAGKVTEVLEKPNWSEAISNSANTGIYFLESKILKEVSDNDNYDFFQYLFSDSFFKKYKIYMYLSDEYWCKIVDIDSYKKVQFDILSGKSDKKIPFVAEGIYTNSSVPNGNFVIVPPVFFDENVQVESGAVIGPFAVVGEGSLISKGSKIRESIIGKSVYVSSMCSVTGAVLMEGVSVKKGVTIFNGAVVGKESLIGEDSIIQNNVLIYANKTIENNLVVSENVKYSKPKNNMMQVNDVIFGDFGVELTPEKTAKLGACIGSLFSGIRVGIGIDGENNSLALKCGLLGGLISVGAKTFDFSECFYSQMFYYSVFCEVDIAIFISGGESGVSLSLCEKGGVPISREKIRKLEEILKLNEFNRSSNEDCHSISTINNIDKMYQSEIVRQFDDVKIKLSALSFFCGNQNLSLTLKGVLEKISFSDENEDFIVKINNIGTKLTVVENNEKFSHEKILAVVAHSEMKKGIDVALPWDAPQIITSLASTLGRKALSLNDYSDSINEGRIKSVSTNQLWSRDAVFLLFKLIKIMSEENKNLKELSMELPEFYVAKKVIEIDASPSIISKELLNKEFKSEKGGGVSIKTKKGIGKVKSDINGKSLRIITEAVSTELAEELCMEIENLISIDIDI